jgi:CheY-like chemotaxis protein
VLCAEDHPDLLVLIRRILDLRPDLELVTARGGAEALALAAAEPPALVLLDLHLGDLPGEEVLRALRADPATAEVPVLVLSADVSPARRERLLAAGARAYLTKPIDIPLLLETLDGVLA